MVVVSFSASGSRTWPGFWFYIVDRGHLWPGSTNPLARLAFTRKPGKCTLARPSHRLYLPDHLFSGRSLVDQLVACMKDAEEK